MSRFLLWSVITLAALAALAAGLTRFVTPPWGLPEQTARVGAAALTVVLAGVAVHRLGGRTVVATLFALVAAGGAVVSGAQWLTAGVAALAATATAVLAVVMTRPAQTPLRVVREYIIAVGCALVGAVAVAAYDVPMRVTLLGNVVLLISLLVTLWLAHRIGGGFTGIGRRGAAVSLSAVVAIASVLAYGEALRRWASPEVVDATASLVDGVRDALGAVPHPTGALIGFPALVWGLATRAQLRQGWWVCAFGAVGTAGVATSLVQGSDVMDSMLSTAYSVLIGLVLGFCLWRLDGLLTGPRGRRARRLERAKPLRPEPPRTHPLR